MYLRRKLFALIIALFTLLPLFSGCSGEDPNAPRKTELLVYVTPEGLCALSGEETVLLAKGKYIHSPHISPDGRYVYYNNSSDIFVVPISAGATPTLAAADAEFSGFCGDRLLSCSASGGVRAYDPETGVSESMFADREEGFVSSVVLSPDEKKLAVCVRQIDVGIDRPRGIYIRYNDTADMDVFTSENICTDPTLLTEPLCWLADGGAIVFSCGKAGELRTKLWLLPVVEGASSPLGPGSMEFRADSRIALSADGKTAAFLTYKSSEDLVETVCILDLTRGKCAYVPSGTSGVSGTALSPDGELVAYTSSGAASGLYVYGNDTTICVSGGDGKNQYAAPVFTDNGQNLLFVGWGDRLLAETDSEGNAVGTYTETVASVWRASPNSAGSTRLADGLKFPDGVYTNSWSDMFDHYQYVPVETEGE